MRRWKINCRRHAVQVRGNLQLVRRDRVEKNKETLMFLGVVRDYYTDPFPHFSLFATGRKGFEVEVPKLETSRLRDSGARGSVKENVAGSGRIGVSGLRDQGEELWGVVRSCELIHEACSCVAEVLLQTLKICSWHRLRGVVCMGTTCWFPFRAFQALNQHANVVAKLISHMPAPIPTVSRYYMLRLSGQSPKRLT